MTRVARFYASASSASRARATTSRSRGLTPETIERFGLGYAPNSWNEVLRRFGAQRRRRASALLRRGLDHRARARPDADGERHYDRFRDRIMFPIRDAPRARHRLRRTHHRPGRAEVPELPGDGAVSQGARAVWPVRGAPRAYQPQRLLVVEGYMDVVRLHQAGIDYAVATLGTATTPEHLKRIFRLVQRGGVRVRRRSRRTRRRLARAAAGAARGARRPRDRASCSCRKGTIRTRLVGDGRPRGLRGAPVRGAAAVGVPGARAVRARRDLTHADGRARFAEQRAAAVREGARRGLPGTAARAASRGRGTVGGTPEELWVRRGAGCGARRRRRCAARARAPPSAPAAAASCARRSCGCCTIPQIAAEVDAGGARRARWQRGARRAAAARADR